MDFQSTLFYTGGLTVYVVPLRGTGLHRAGVDSAWEQEKPEARNMPKYAEESHTSGACFIGQLWIFMDLFLRVQSHLLGQ